MAGTEVGDAIRRRHREGHADALDGFTVAPWIDGKSRYPDVAHTVGTRDPVVDEPMVEVPVCDAAAVDRAVAVP